MIYRRYRRIIGAAFLLGQGALLSQYGSDPQPWALIATALSLACWWGAIELIVREAGSRAR